MKITNEKHLEKGLKKTRTGFISKIQKLVLGKSKINDDFLDDLEETLISSDVGVDTTLKIIARIESTVSKEKYLNEDELLQILNKEISDLLPADKPLLENISTAPKIILVVGVNGVGKTTTIGKLAYKYHSQGLKVILGAADTFRAGAIDQLQIWADKIGCPMIKKQQGSDPASVAFETTRSGKTQNADIIIIDTAGRLHNKVNLMNELSKIKSTIKKVIPNAPHEVLLVLDGSTGQNAFEQAKQFSKVTKITALAITKLDGTAKGGVVIGISDQINVPVKFIGVGESIEDLQVFKKETFIKTLFSKS